LSTLTKLTILTGIEIIRFLGAAILTSRRTILTR
jgi:hypothetical protein